LKLNQKYRGTALVNSPRRHTHHGQIISHISYHCRTRTHHYTFTEPHQLTHTRTDTNPGQITNGNSTGQPRPWADMYRSAKLTIVVNAAASIQYGPHTNTSIGINHCSAKNHRALTERRVVTQCGCGMDQTAQACASCLQLQQFCMADTIITNGNNYSVKLLNALK